MTTVREARSHDATWYALHDERPEFLIAMSMQWRNKLKVDDMMMAAPADDLTGLVQRLRDRSLGAGVSAGLCADLRWSADRIEASQADLTRALHWRGDFEEACRQRDAAEARAAELQEQLRVAVARIGELTKIATEDCEINARLEARAAAAEGDAQRLRALLRASLWHIGDKTLWNACKAAIDAVIAAQEGSHE